MAGRISISIRDLPNLGKIIKKKAEKALANGNPLGVTLRSQAVARIKAGRDSTHTYPELWANKVPGHYRAGGRPLQNNGHLMAGLHSETVMRSNGISVTLKDGSGYGVYHQNGFKTKGPNYIPLSLKGARRHVKGRNPEEEGLERRRCSTTKDFQHATREPTRAWGNRCQRNQEHEVKNV